MRMVRSICNRYSLFLEVKGKLLMLCVPFLQEFFMLSNLNRLAETASNTSSSTKSPLAQCLTKPEEQRILVMEESKEGGQQGRARSLKITPVKTLKHHQTMP